jgi:cell wall-associated NlpC family hydrolase
MRLERSSRTAVRTPPSRRRRIVVSAVVLAAFALPVLLPGTASADQISDKQTQATQVASKLDDLNQKLSALDEQYNQAVIQLDTAQKNVADAQIRLDATNAQLDVAAQQLRSFAVQAYMTGNDTPAFEAALTSSAQDAAQKKSYLEAASRSRQDLLDQLHSMKQQAATETAKVSEAQSQAQKVEASIKQAKDQADTAVAEQAQINSQVKGELATLVHEQQQAQAAAQATAAKASADAAAAQQAATQRTAATQTAPQAGPVQSADTGGGTTTPIGSPSGGAGAAIAAAQSMLGVPYVWAGASPSGFDCSGLTLWAWAHGGKTLPHSAASQYAMSQHIPVSALQPGDLVFFTEGGSIGHVGLYIGGGMMIHAPHSGSVVKIDSIYFWTTPLAGRI